jgi:hypothetical protein
LFFFFQINADVEKAKQLITDLKAAMTSAQTKQRDAREECKKLERDMEEFKTNKDGKIDELKVNFFLFRSNNNLNGVMFRKTAQNKRQISRSTTLFLRPNKKSCRQQSWSWVRILYLRLICPSDCFTIDQMEQDLLADKQGLTEANESIAKLVKELEKQDIELKKSEVCSSTN